jgi:hypothetical protein
MILRPVKWVLVPKGEPIFSENGFAVEIEDEAGGEFVTITEARAGQKISIDPTEWRALRAAVDAVFNELE